MSTEEIKSILHESIENIDDVKFLESVKSLIEGKYKILPPLKVSEKHKEILNNSINQIQNGEFYTDEEVKKLTDEWLKE